MSESASILEKEISRDFRPVDRLSVNNQGEGLSSWVPSDDIEVSSLTASENGLFLAFEDECDAYDEIEVDVPEDVADTEDKSGKISGKDPNDGNDYEVGLDDDGTLTTEMIPAGIHIVVPPIKRHYQHGETLQFAGIHVYLMDGSGHRYTSPDYPTGEIPFVELIFPVTVAEGNDSEVGVNDGGSLISMTNGTLTQSITVEPTNNSEDVYAIAYYYNFTVDENTPTQGSCAGIIIFASRKSFVVNVENVSSADSSQSTDTATKVSNDLYTYNRSLKLTASIVDEISISADYGVLCTKSYYDDISTNTEARNEIARGLIEGSGNNETDQIPVQWMRSDGATLEDTFTITVGEEGEDEPQPPDPYEGACDFYWEGKGYNFNSRLARNEIMFSNGTIYQTWMGGQSPPYTIEQALKLGLIVEGSSSGHSTGSF